MSEGSDNQQRFCTSCGTQIRSGTQFCVNCGANLIPPTPKRLETPDRQIAETSAAPSGPSISERFGSMMNSLGQVFSGLKARFSSSSYSSGNTWRGTPSRFLSWFRDITFDAKIVFAALVIIPVLLIFALLGPVLRVAAILVLIVSLIALVIQAIQRKPVTLWGMSAVVSLVLIPIFGLSSNMFYGGFNSSPEQGSAVANQYGVVDEESGRVTLPNGITSSLPEGWTIVEPSAGREAYVDMVPSAYSDTSSDLNEAFEIADEQAMVEVSNSLSVACESGLENVEQTESVELNEEMFNHFDYGFSDVWTASGTMTSGEATIAGEEAQWSIRFNANSSPWVYDWVDTYGYPASSNYPGLFTVVTIDVCSKDLDLQASMVMSQTPFGLGETESGSVEPTFDDNAAVPETNLEVRDELRRQYAENVSDFIYLLENMDDSGWWNNSDVSTIPTTIDGFDESLEDPFQGELDYVIE